jgi:serine/threonine protein phosphatase PrpC
VAGRASIVGAAATHVGKVREHNEDAHFLDVDLGLFLVCDGMGGHAAGEVASALAIRAIRQEWASDGLRAAISQWLERGTPETKKQLLEVVRAGVVTAHGAILAEAERDESKTGMGTTLVGALAVGGELVFAHAGDSRAYLVRDGISMQLTEDHTLLARLLAAGIDVDVSGEGSRFRSMLTNALGIGDECKVSTFVVPLADGDRFLLCSDGISEYVPENEVGDVLTKQPSPARAAQRLIDLALERGGGDNATAVVVRVLEAGETPLPAEQRTRDDAAIAACALWGTRVTPQQRLRALRIAIPRDHNISEKLPAHTLGDRVAWIIVEGTLVQDGVQLGPGALVYPESLISGPEAPPPPDRDALAITRSDVRALAIRADDFRELCDDDGELGETLLESLARVIARRRPRTVVRDAGPPVDPRGNTDPHLRAVESRDVAEAYHPTDPDMRAVDGETETVRERAPTIPDDEPTLLRAPIPTRPQPADESATSAPAPARPPAEAPSRPSPVPAQTTKRGASPASARAPSRPTPPPAQAQAPSPPSTPRPARPTPGPAPASSAPSTPRPARPTPGPTPAQTHAAAALPHTPSPPHGIAKAQITGATRRSTPAGGTPPLTAPSVPPPADGAATNVASAQRAPAPTGNAPRAKSDSSWDIPTVRTRPRTDSPEDATPPRPEARGSHVIARSTLKNSSPAITLPADTPPERSPTPLPLAPPSPRGDGRPTTEPEIETYLEIEAELPPESGSDVVPAPSAALADLDDEHESVSITIEDGSTRVIETVTETGTLTLTLTVTEPPPEEPTRSQSITAQDGATVSGTIKDSPAPPRRTKRKNEGRDE